MTINKNIYRSLIDAFSPNIITMLWGEQTTLCKYLVRGRRTISMLASITALCLATPATSASKIAASGRYFCNDGSVIVFTETHYGPIMERDGRSVRLAPRAVFRGFSYKGGEFSVRGRGAEGNQTVSVKAAGLDINCNALPAVAAPGTAAGTIVSIKPMQLPTGAILTVSVHDYARAGSERVVLGQVQVKVDGRRSPLHWWLRYDSDRAKYPAQPALSAQITDHAGRLLWKSTTFTPVPVGGPNTFAQANIKVMPVRR